MVLDWSGTILPRYYLVRNVPNQANLPAVAGRFPKAQDITELSKLFPTEKMRSDDDEDADEVDRFDVFQVPMGRRSALGSSHHLLCHSYYGRYSSPSSPS